MNAIVFGGSRGIGAAIATRLAHAWLLAQHEWIVPIPGTTKLKRLRENLGGIDLELTAGDLSEIEAGTSEILIEGERLPEAMLKMTGH